MLDSYSPRQQLRQFTVQIRTPDFKAIAGTGIAMDVRGVFVTCAHVVQMALKRDARHKPQVGDTVGVRFPQARVGDRREALAQVTRCFDRYADDVVVLELTEGYPPTDLSSAVLGHAAESEGNPFRSYGYRPLGRVEGAPAQGTIVGYGGVPTEEAEAYQGEPVVLESSQLNRGMSGAAVLDMARNLVVGVVSDVYFPDADTKDRDTALAVDARVLSLDPLNLPVRDTPLSPPAAPQVQPAEPDTRAQFTPITQVDLSRAPAPLKEWVGRADLLKALDADWGNPNARALGLIGFGGEGKSSLARRWLDSFLSSPTSPLSPPPSIFWWSFYTAPSAEEFLEAALRHFTGLDPRQVTGASRRANLIVDALLLSQTRAVVVLDGLEVLQRMDDTDARSTLTSHDLREFLTLWTGNAHRALAVITSRLPMLDLLNFPAYRHHDVERLTAIEGRVLLREVGVRGPDEPLDKLVREWDGHALTLSLLGSYLKDAHGGDAAKLSDLPPPTSDENRYQRVHRILARYDEHLTPAQQTFLTRFSAFRTPVTKAAFKKVFLAKEPNLWQRFTGLFDPQAKLPTAGEAKLDTLFASLETARLLKRDADDTYTTHPLIRAHYHACLLAGNTVNARETHVRLKEHYLALAGDTPQYPTLDDLRPLIEVVHHACQAKVYDEAINLFWERIYQRTRYVLTHLLGAYETNFAIMSEFFPNGDTACDPLVNNSNFKRFILNEVGYCLMNLGHLSEATPFYERYVHGNTDAQDWINASIGYINLADLHAYLGRLRASAQTAGEALTFARRAADKYRERQALANQAFAAHLLGESDLAHTAFAQAEVLEREINSTKRYLYSNRGIFHADHLRRAGDATSLTLARRVTEANLEICEQYHVVNDTALCHRTLGDLDAAEGQLNSTLAHYDQALVIARGISDRATLIEVLLARGRFFAHQRREATAARADLDEALAYAQQGGYRRYQADLYNALAWAALAAQDIALAHTLAGQARRLSEEMEYHWGQVDAEEVVRAVEG